MYKLSCDGSKQYVGKLYFRHSVDARDRLGVEFSALRFLWKNDIRSIPRPIAADEEQGCALYEYIEGDKVSTLQVSDSDIDSAVRFLSSLRELTQAKGSDHLPLASEACFSVQAIVDNVNRRMDRLVGLPGIRARHGALYEFLTGEFAPAFRDFTARSRSSADRLEVPFESEIPVGNRTLSPSDFGLHNALRRRDGQIVFLDFEYFGWDDPAKMICDFLLHPAMDLEQSLKQRFTSGVLGNFQDGERLANRAEVVYPLFGLKWCLILLNEFIPETLLRRGFANETGLGEVELQTQQLAKAKGLLSNIKRHNERFLPNG